jgi:O-antigen/teichoic acid export membrane protein
LNGAGGLIFLFLTVRGLAPVQYGNYIVLLAALEVISLASSLGVFGFAQRYLPEFRIRGDAWLLSRSLLVCFGIRAVTLLASAAILVFAQERLTHTFDVDVGHAAFSLFAAWLIVEGLCRLLDNVTDSLLFQATTQLSGFIRTWLKVIALTTLAFTSGFTLSELLVFELVGSTVALVVTIFLVFRAISRSAETTQGRHYRPDWKTIFRFSCQHYVALLFSQIYGYSALKLLLSALAGPVVTAAYGFAQSLVDMVRRYLPVQLLLGMVRPLIIASYAREMNVERPLFLSNLVFKLNVFLIAPVFAVSITFGGQLTEFIHRGKYPEAYTILIPFLAILVLQTLHMVLSMLAMSLEHGGMILRGTVIASSGIVIAALLIPSMGAWGALIAAAASEVAFCAVVAGGINMRYRRAVVSWRGHVRIWLLAASTAAIAWVATAPFSMDGLLSAIIGSVIAVVSYFSLALWWRPFSREQRDTLNRALPRPVFVW